MFICGIDSDVTPNGILEGVSKLREAGIQPRTVIIDDGWQDVTPRKQKLQPETIEKAQSGPISTRVQQILKQLLTSLMVSLLSIASRVITAYYERYVKTANYNSMPNRIWRKLTSTVLKGE